MDFPISVPGIGLVDGKFIDEDALAGTPGSLIPSAWGNAITLEVLNVINAAGLAPSEADLTQLLQAIRLIGQTAAGNFAADTGAANAYEVAYSPAVAALIDGLVLRFKAKAGNSGASTFSPNGLTARPIVGLGLLALQGNEIAVNGLCTVVWSATLNSWVLVQNSGGPVQVSPATRAAHAVTADQLQQQAMTAFTTSGAGPAFTLSPLPLLAAYAANQRFRVKFGAASTGADTLNISGRGAKSLKQYDASGAKVAAVFAANQLSDVEYDGVDMVLLNPLPSSTLLPYNYFSGFLLANNAVAPNTTVDVAAGIARDTTDSVSIKLSSTIRGVLQASGSWAAGDNQNKLDTGAKAINTCYHVFAIRKISDGTGDIVFSLSPTAPTMPTGYSGFRRISAVLTNASGNIIPFTNVGPYFTWKDPIVDVNTAATQLTPALFTLSVPTGVNTMARFGVGGYAGGSDIGLTYTPVSSNNIPNGGTSSYLGGLSIATTATDNGAGMNTECIAEGGQIRGTSVNRLLIVTFGWMEIR
ncbi:hypothetical protein ACM1ZW_19765 [Pseudomonas sp. NFX71]|uniref:hypothetical protein n=1 Tax=Pseudomonas sp. NFX71 TaxID=3399121 RepID=UPI003A8C19E1